MSSVSADHKVKAGAPKGSANGDASRIDPQAAKNFLVDLSTIDLTKRIKNRTDLEHYMPHRGDMLFLDAIVWQAADCKQGVALKHVRSDEFWVPGHFPDRPLLPGVLQVEAGAQLAVFLYNARMPEPLTPAFTRIENCSFRSMVQPGDDLYLLCQEVKWSRRGFTCNVQGVCNGKMTFEAQVQGLVI
jgi:3-hydroxymyristoyl/3-hydroxydecanoyl-(acyl carrier protein) dehydratase